MRLTIYGEVVIALIDTEAEVSVISIELAEQLSLPVLQDPDIIMRGPTGQNIFNKVIYAVPVNIRGVTYNISIFMLRELNIEFLLRSNYQKVAQLNLN